MKLEIESTEQFLPGPFPRARLWRGVTAGGATCELAVADLGAIPGIDCSEFDAELESADSDWPSQLLVLGPVRIELEPDDRLVVIARLSADSRAELIVANPGAVNVGPEAGGNTADLWMLAGMLLARIAVQIRNLPPRYKVAASPEETLAGTIENAAEEARRFLPDELAATRFHAVERLRT